MADHEKNIAIYQKIIEIIKELLATGDWQASLFLKTAQKKLETFLKEAEELLEELTQVDAPKEPHADKEKQGWIKVYISIYQSDPHNFSKWETTLKSITEYSVTRPIYRSEEHIKEIIRSKLIPINEAYVIAYIKQSDIIPPYTGKMIEDKFGHELLTIRETAIKISNVLEFVHNEKRYLFQDGKLLLKSDTK